MAAVGPAIAALGISQIVGWGTTHYMPAILTAPMATGLGLSPTAVFGGFSWGILVAGLTARTTGRLIDRLGARKVMSAASASAAAGLLALAAARGLVGMLVGWTLLGLALRSILYDGAFAALTVLAGAGARRAISLVTLFGGLASTVFWPIGHWLDAELGWRTTLVVYATLNLAVCLPLHWHFAGGPAQPARGDGAGDDAAHPGIGLSGVHRRIALWLVAATFTLHAFVNSTISLEGVMRWLVASGYRGDKQPVMGCFDWDPFVLLLGHDIVMVKQDVNKMLQAAFALIDANSQEKRLIEIPPIFPEMI